MNFKKIKQNKLLVLSYLKTKKMKNIILLIFKIKMEE